MTIRCWTEPSDDGARSLWYAEMRDRNGHVTRSNGWERQSRAVDQALDNYWAETGEPADPRDVTVKVVGAER